MTDKNIHFSKLSDEWNTADDFFHLLDKEWKFDVDVAASKDNFKVKTYFTKEDDALSMDHWAKRGDVCWMNPPYSKVGKFIKKADEQWKKNGIITVALIAARTDTQYFHNYIWDKWQNISRDGISCFFLEGRLKFYLPITTEVEQAVFKGEKVPKCVHNAMALDLPTATDFAPFPSLLVVFGSEKGCFYPPSKRSH